MPGGQVPSFSEYSQQDQPSGRVSIEGMNLGKDKFMEYNDIKECLMVCPALAGLDETATAALFWRGEEQTLEEGEIIYAESQPLDHTFCLLLSGDLVVERGGEIIGGIGERQIFGEMAYFTNRHTRTATIRVGSDKAVVLKFQLTPEELASAPFSALKKCLERQTWNRFVNTSQADW
jgi:hypothetical protein